MNSTYNLSENLHFTPLFSEEDISYKLHLDTKQKLIIDEYFQTLSSGSIPSNANTDILPSSNKYYSLISHQSSDEYKYIHSSFLPSPSLSPSAHNAFRLLVYMGIHPAYALQAASLFEDNARGAFEWLLLHLEDDELPVSVQGTALYHAELYARYPRVVQLFVSYGFTRKQCLEAIRLSAEYLREQHARTGKTKGKKKKQEKLIVLKTGNTTGPTSADEWDPYVYVSFLFELAFPFIYTPKNNSHEAKPKRKRRSEKKTVESLEMEKDEREQDAPEDMLTPENEAEEAVEHTQQIPSSAEQPNISASSDEILDADEQIIASVE